MSELTKAEQLLADAKRIEEELRFEGKNIFCKIYPDNVYIGNNEDRVTTSHFNAKSIASFIVDRMFTDDEKQKLLASDKPDIEAPQKDAEPKDAPLLPTKLGEPIDPRKFLLTENGWNIEGRVYKDPTEEFEYVFVADKLSKYLWNWKSGGAPGYCWVMPDYNRCGHFIDPAPEADNEA